MLGKLFSAQQQCVTHFPWTTTDQDRSDLTVRDRVTTGIVSPGVVESFCLTVKAVNVSSVELLDHVVFGNATLAQRSSSVKLLQTPTSPDDFALLLGRPAPLTTFFPSDASQSEFLTTHFKKIMPKICGMNKTELNMLKPYYINSTVCPSCFTVSEAYGCARKTHRNMHCYDVFFVACFFLDHNVQFYTNSNHFTHYY